MHASSVTGKDLIATDSMRTQRTCWQDRGGVGQDGRCARYAELLGKSRRRSTGSFVTRPAGGRGDADGLRAGVQFDLLAEGQAGAGGRDWWTR